MRIGARKKTKIEYVHHCWSDRHCSPKSFLMLIIVLRRTTLKCNHAGTLMAHHYFRNINIQSKPMTTKPQPNQIVVILSDRTTTRAVITRLISQKYLV